MMMNEKNVRIEKNKNDFYEAYYDVTDLFVNLPTYIKKIEVVCFKNMENFDSFILISEIWPLFVASYPGHMLVSENYKRFRGTRSRYISFRQWGAYS